MLYIVLKMGSCGNSKGSCGNSKRCCFLTKMSENNSFWSYHNSSFLTVYIGITESLLVRKQEIQILALQKQVNIIVSAKVYRV